MHTSRVSALLAAALLLMPLQRSSADTRYVWSDASGDEHVTREPPPQGILYARINIPDAVSWRRRPDMPKALTPKTPPSAQELFNQASSSIYWVESIEGDRRDSERIAHYGSAVAISDELALTNCHVTRGSGAQLTIGTGRTDETGEAELEAADFDADRCVIRSRTLSLHAVKGIRRYDTLEVGETVYTIGNPRRLERTLGNGLVSGKRELEGERWIQFTAPISRGSSGGGLFDAQGNLIGITTLSMRDAQGINFAIPAEEFWR
jgi:serine protease Do